MKLMGTIIIPDWFYKWLLEHFTFLSKTLSPVQQLLWNWTITSFQSELSSILATAPGLRLKPDVRYLTSRRSYQRNLQYIKTSCQVTNTLFWSWLLSALLILSACIFSLVLPKEPQLFIEWRQIVNRELFVVGLVEELEVMRSRCVSPGT